MIEIAKLKGLVDSPVGCVAIQRKAIAVRIGEMCQAALFKTVFHRLLERRRLERTSEGHLAQIQLEQGNTESPVMNHVQTAFEYLQGGRLHNSLVQSFPVLSHLRSKEVLPVVQM